jgi:hypothetical protein
MDTLRVHMDGAQAVEFVWSGWGCGWVQIDFLRKCKYVLGRVQEDGRECAD